jgi:hypothetical protein
MAVKTFSPKEVGILFGGIDLQGWNTVTVRRSEALFTKVSSADGREIARARNDDKSGQVEIEFQQFSDSNAILDAVRRQDEASATGVATFKLVNKLSGEESFSSEAWISDVGEIAYTNEVGTRTWMLDLASVEYDLTPQSNVVLSVISNIANFFSDLF